MERDAAIARAVIVAAFVARAGVAEQEGAGVQHRRAGIRPIAERPLEHGRDRELLMPLLEGAIMRAGGAQVFANAPFLAVMQRARNRKALDGTAAVSLHRSNLANIPHPENRGTLRAAISRVLRRF